MEATNSGLTINVKKTIALVVTVVFITTAVLLQTGIDSGRKDMGLSSNGIKSNASTFLELLGGLRTAAAAFLWIKIDRIHDGYYGELTKEDELIPLYRIVTWLNPNIEDAYYVGSYMLCQAKRPDEGWNFALEGLKLNPESSKMELNVGQLALFYQNDYKTAIYHLKRASALAKDDEEKVQALQNLKAAYLKDNMKDKAEAVRKVVASITKDWRPQSSKDQ